MESERRINWLSLFIKIIIIFIFVLIIIWLVSKIISHNKLSKAFTENINNMEKVAVDYFKEIDLPLEKGKSTKITLQEMIDKKLIVSINKDGEKTCDTKKSYSKITRQKSNYTVKTTLECGKEKKTISKKFPLSDCRNCKQTTDEEKKETNTSTSSEDKTGTNDSSSSSSNSGNNSSSSNGSSSSNTTGTTYYEYVKETTSYSKWMRGDITGNNVENKYQYYEVAKDTYYTVGYVSKSEIGSSNTYTIKLDKIPNSKYYFTTIENVEYYNTGDEGNYLNNSKSSLSDAKINLPSSISTYALKDGDFSYKLSPYYRKGSFYIDTNISVISANAKDYYDSSLKDNVYLVPLKVTVKFASNVITDTKPSTDYETISYYRYVETNREVIWSDKSSVDGYTKTGNTKVE